MCTAWQLAQGGQLAPVCQTSPPGRRWGSVVQAVLLTHLLRIVIRRSLLHCHVGEMNIWHEIEIRIKAKQTLSK